MLSATALQRESVNGCQSDPQPNQKSRGPGVRVQPWGPGLGSRAGCLDFWLFLRADPAPSLHHPAWFFFNSFFEHFPNCFFSGK